MRYLGIPLLKIGKKNGLAPQKESFYEFSQFLQFLHLVVLFTLGLLSSSFCIESGKISEESNHMLSATSEIGLEFLTKFLKMSKFQNRLVLLYQKARYIITSHFIKMPSPSPCNLTKYDYAS